MNRRLWTILLTAQILVACSKGSDSSQTTPSGEDNKASAQSHVHDCVVYNTYQATKYYSGKITDHQVILVDSKYGVEIKDLAEISGYEPPKGTKEYFFVSTSQPLGDSSAEWTLTFISSNNVIAGGSDKVFLTGNEGITLECKN